MKETKTLSKFTVEMKETEYELYGGGGSHPAPGSVGSDEIKDDSIQMEDLNQTVKDQMMTEGDRVTQDDLDNFQV